MCRIYHNPTTDPAFLALTRIRYLWEFEHDVWFYILASEKEIGVKIMGTSIGQELVINIIIYGGLRFQ